MSLLYINVQTSTHALEVSIVIVSWVMKAILCAVCSYGYASSTFHSGQNQKCIKCGADAIGILNLIASYVAQGVVIMSFYRIATRRHNAAAGFLQNNSFPFSGYGGSFYITNLFSKHLSQTCSQLVCFFCH